MDHLVLSDSGQMLLRGHSSNMLEPHAESGGRGCVKGSSSTTYIIQSVIRLACHIGLLPVRISITFLCNDIGDGSVFARNVVFPRPSNHLLKLT
jgi:hypothetical protein